MAEQQELEVQETPTTEQRETEVPDPGTQVFHQGLTDSDAEKEWSDEALFGEEQAVEEPSEESEVETPEEPAPSEPAAEPSQEPEAQAPETQPEPETPKPEEAGVEHDPRFKNLRRLQVRTAEQLKAAETRAQQLEAALQEAARLQQQPDEELDPYALLDPQVLKQTIEAQVAQRTQQAAQAQMQALKQAQLAESLSNAITTFRSAHPEAASGTELDTRVAEVMLELQTPEGGTEPSLDLYPFTPENLEIALQLAQEPELHEAVIDLDLLPDGETIELAREALKNPALYEEFKADPGLLDSDEGIAVAKRRANLPGMYQQATQKVAATLDPEAMRKAAHVETGGSGAPVAGAPGTTPDEMDQAIAAWKQDQGGSIF